MEDGITSGKFDLYGNLLDEEEGILGDLKITNSYKLMRALGIYKVDVETGEVYKTGAKKGQPKTRKEFRYDGMKDIFDWAIQLNYYRKLLEREGYQVNRMVIQAICRDSNLKTAAERGITQKSYLIEINKISDHWLQKYFSKKAEMLKTALENQELPPIRGYKQWQMIGRQVKKGTKAIYIFSPATKIIKEKNAEGEEEKKIIIKGFYPMSVFRYEDTEGEKLPEYDYKPEKYPPFFDVAEKLGIEVSYKPLKYDYYGKYNSKRDRIELCSESAVTYYHELAHALDNRLNGELKKSSERRNEIVAEFSAVVLCQLSGIEGYEDQSYRYIKHYCENDKSDNAILKSIMKILSDVEKIVEEVLNVSEDVELLKKVA